MSKSIPDFRLSIVLILISFLIFWLDSIHFLSFLQKGASFITNPISFGLYQTNKDISKQFEYVFQARVASLENNALKEQLASLLS